MSATHATTSTERTPLIPSSSSSSTSHTIHNSPLNRLSSPQISFPKSNPNQRQSSYPFPTIPARQDSYDPLKIYRQSKIHHGDPDFASHSRPIPSPSAFSSSGLSSMSGESDTAVGTDHSHGRHHKHHHHHQHHRHNPLRPNRHGTAEYEFGIRHDGLPKLSRECLISEIKCYGRYMIPPLLVFGVLAIGAALIAVSIRRGWI